jgi:hypothetical protein
MVCQHIAGYRLCSAQELPSGYLDSDADPDPASGALLTPGPGWVKNQDPDLGSGSE